MSSHDRFPDEGAPEGEARREESRDDGHISFVQRLQRHFGHDVEPITLQAPEESEVESKVESAGESAGEEESSSPSLGLVKKLAGQASLGPRYQITREVARGGMGTILRVWDEDLRRNLAMKVMHGHGRVDDESGSSNIDQEKLGRFLEEAQITGQLDHPGIVPVHDLGIDDDGQCYFTMRLVRGRELKEVLDLAREQKEGWTRTKALALILKVCEAMAYAHSKGVVHRDLKPSNVMVGRFGEVYVMDWGLARVLGRHDSHDIRLRPVPEDASAMSLVKTVRKDESEANPDSPLITMDGDVVGTPSYMAVEQAQGKLDEVGQRSDVYSLGSILYYMLTGRAPYVKPDERVSPHTILNRVLQGPPEPVSKFARDVPAELLAICDKSMERQASERYGSMLEVADDIQAYLEDRVVSAYEGGSLAEFRKWVARNRGMAAGIAGMVTLSIASALGFGLQQQGQVDALNQEKGETAAARDDADRKADQLEDALEVAQANEHEATASALAAAISENEARRSSYTANITAADYSLKLNDVEEARARVRNCDLRLRGWEWDHLRLKANPALRTIGKFGLGVAQVATSPDGAMVLSLTRNGRVRFNELGTGETVAPGVLTALVVPSLQAGFVSLGMDLAADGTQLAVVGYKERIKVFDLLSGSEEPVLDLPGPGTRGHGAQVGAVAFSRDGRYLISGADNGSIIQWDTLGELVTTYGGHRRQITDLAWSPDSRLFASSAIDGTVRVWDATVGQQLHELRGHQDRVNALVWDFTGTRLFSAGSDKLVNEWDVGDRGRLVASFSGHAGAVHSVDFDPVGERLVTGSEDRTVRVWDVRSTREIALLRSHEAAVTDVKFTPDGRQVVSSAADGVVLVWDRRGDLAETDLGFRAWGLANEVAEEAEATDPPIEAVAFHADGIRVATGGGTLEAGELVIWNSRSGEPLRRLRGHESLITDVVFSPDGHFLFSSSLDRTVRRWDAETGRLSSIYRHDAPLHALALSLDGTRLITAGRDKLVRILDTETGDVLHELEGHRRVPSDIAVSPDGKSFATCGLDVRVWNLRTQEAEQVFPGGSTIFSLAYSPDGSQIAATRLKGDVVIWKSNGESVATVGDHAYRLRAIAYSPDGKRIASGAGDSTVRIRDAVDGQTIFILDWEGADIVDLAFSADGKRLLAGSKDGRVRIWETGGVKERREASLAALEGRADAEPLVASLFDRVFYLQDVVLALQDDDTLDPALRQMAVRMANLRGDDPAPLVTKSMEEALISGRTPEAYERARDRAFAARELEGSPTSARVSLTLGMTQYRSGDYDEAARALERASRDDEDGSISSSDETVRLLFHAMSLFRGGHGSGANVSLTLANVKIEEDPRLRYSNDLESLLDEAESLILGDGGS